jgi:hypothetical protein
VRLDWSMVARVAMLLAVSLGLAAGARAGAKKGQGGQNSSETVAAGSFGVFIPGQRAATETFTIRQQANTSTIKAQLQQTSVADPVSQKSNLEITANGGGLRYEWSQSSVASLAVLPNNQFLLEKISTPSSSKPAERPFLMANTSFILDNNFFVHREVLVWRYLATSLEARRQQFPVPTGSGKFRSTCSSGPELDAGAPGTGGQEKIQVRRTDRDLMRVNLKDDDFDSALGLDEQDHFKLIECSCPAAQAKPPQEKVIVNG